MTFMDLFQDNNQNQTPMNDQNMPDQSTDINPEGSAGGVAQHGTDDRPMRDIENTPDMNVPDQADED